MTAGPGREIRRARPEDGESIGPLWASSFNLPPRWVEKFEERFHPERVLVAVEGDRVLATAQGYATAQWFGGRPLDTIGIASVATDPIARGTGIGADVMRRLLEDARAAGNTLASLYPSTLPFYRRLGFEYGGTFTVHRVLLGDLPSARSGWGKDAAADLVAMPEDHEPIRRSFRRLAERENGLVEGLEEDWWRQRVLGRHSAEEPGGTVATDEGDAPEGYAAYRQERLGEAADWGYRVACTHLVAHSPHAAIALLGFFRRFKGVGRELTWQGPPSDPMAFLLPEQTLQVARTWRFMSRILDVPAALEDRGYPEDVNGETVFAVEDPQFPDNRGPFRLEAEGGKVRVSGADGNDWDGGPPIPIGALSTMFAAYVSPAAAGRAGLVDPRSPCLRLFSRLFAGPAPWTPDFF